MSEVKAKVANPGPLGLLGFGMTTVLLNLHNAGLLPLSIAIVAMGIALGGLAQIIAGIRELCQGNTFAGTAFTAYGLFWWSLVLIWVNPFAAAGIEAASKVLQEKFLSSDLYRNARTIYGYLPYNQEVRTVPILERALADGKRVAVPKVYADEMRFIYLTDLSLVETGYSGIPEPIADGPEGDDPTALVLMPGLAFTREGQRIGYGGGFYDKFLAAEPNHPTVALCYDFQIVEQLPTEEYDIPVHEVIWPGREA